MLSRFKIGIVSTQLNARVTSLSVTLLSGSFSIIFSITPWARCVALSPDFKIDNIILPYFLVFETWKRLKLTTFVDRVTILDVADYWLFRAKRVDTASQEKEKNTSGRKNVTLRCELDCKQHVFPQRRFVILRQNFRRHPPKRSTYSVSIKRTAPVKSDTQPVVNPLNPYWLALGNNNVFWPNFTMN